MISLRSLILTLTASALVAGSALAQSDSPRISTLSLTGQGVVTAKPDVATVQVGVEVIRKTAKEAIAENSTLLGAALKAAKDSGIEPRDLQTAGLSLSPDTVRPDKNQPVRIVGYQANNMLSIRVRDIEKLGGLLDRLIVAGANDIQGIRFSIDNRAPLIEEARKLAIKDVLRKANIYAEAANLRIVRILSISESGVNFPQPIMLQRQAAPGRPDVPVEAGELAVTVQVNMSFEVAPK